MSLLDSGRMSEANEEGGGNKCTGEPDHDTEREKEGPREELRRGMRGIGTCPDKAIAPILL